MRVPARIAAGDDVLWLDESFVDSQGRTISTATHSLAYSFRGPLAAGKVDVTSTINGGRFQTTLTSAQTSKFNLTASNLVWYWQAFATETSGGSRYVVGEGSLLVKPNLSASSNVEFDGRTQSEKDLAAVRDAISARISGGMVTHYTIGSRNLQREPMAALLALETRLAQKVAREKAAQALANGRGNPGKSFVRFTSRNY